MRAICAGESPERACARQQCATRWRRRMGSTPWRCAAPKVSGTLAIDNGAFQTYHYDSLNLKVDYSGARIGLDAVLQQTSPAVLLLDLRAKEARDLLDQVRQGWPETLVVALGTPAKRRVASVSQVPIAVPPSARKPVTAALASARVRGSIRAMSGSGPCG